jgi:hypothetical protein
MPIIMNLYRARKHNLERRTVRKADGSISRLGTFPISARDLGTEHHIPSAPHRSMSPKGRKSRQQQVLSLTRADKHGIVPLGTILEAIAADNTPRSRRKGLCKLANAG